MAEQRRVLRRSALALAPHLVGRFEDEAFRAIFETSGEALLIISQQGALERANRRARQLLGITSMSTGPRDFAGFFSGHIIPQLSSLASLPNAPQSFDAFLESGLEVRLILRSILPGSLHLLLCLEENPANSAKVAEQKWRQLESELHCVLDSVEAGIILFDSEGLLRFFNTRFAEFFGLELAHLETIGAFEELDAAVASKLGSPRAFRSRWELFKAGRAGPATEEIDVVRPNPRVLERFSRPVPGPQGCAAGWLEIYTDVTAYRQIQSKMLQTEKMAALGQVVSGIAHELNNPLTSIMGYAQLLLGHGLAPSQLGQAQNVYQEAERARRIVKNLLYFARENRPERVIADLNEIAERTLALRSYELKVENIAVECDFLPGLPKTMADPYQLQQVVLNLLMNAEQALLEKQGRGRITIRTRLIEQPSGSRISLEVSDNGPGIPSEIAARIFDPFFTTKAPGAGTGLGLSIVYGIVRQHDGDVIFENLPGGGAKFSVELPVILGSTTPQGSRIHSAGPLFRASPGRILVVEDEPTVARLIADILREEGHQAEAVLDSRKGLALLSQHPYDLVLCDLRMPDLDGRAFYQALVRAASPMQHKILFITGDTLGPATVEFLELSCLPYLAKPFLVEELKSAVNQQLDANRKGAAASLLHLPEGAHAGE